MPPLLAVCCVSHGSMDATGTKLLFYENKKRSLDLSVGNHKKQCLDGFGPPVAPAGEAASASAATPGTTDQSTGGTSNPTAFEPFDFLRGLGGGGSSGASASASSSSTVAGTKPSAGVPIAIAPKGDLPSAAGGGVAGAGAAVAPPSPSPPSLAIPQQKQKAEVNPQAKKARQVRFMRAGPSLPLGSVMLP